MLWVHEQTNSQVWVAKKDDGTMLGVIAGTLDRPTIYRRIVKKHVLRISLSVLTKLYKPAVLSWISRAILERLQLRTNVNSRSIAKPAAELLLIAVTDAAKGTGVARLLVEHMEHHFRQWGFKGSYLILTLANNSRANAFYTRLGATLVTQTPARGMLVNEYHKHLSSHGE